MTGTPSGNKERKRKLERRRLIKCGFCPYHRSENGTSRKPRSDKYKAKRIRGIDKRAR